MCSQRATFAAGPGRRVARGLRIAGAPTGAQRGRAVNPARRLPSSLHIPRLVDRFVGHPQPGRFGNMWTHARSAGGTSVGEASPATAPAADVSHTSSRFNRRCRCAASARFLRPDRTDNPTGRAARPPPQR